MKAKLLVIAVLGIFIIGCMGDGKRSRRSDFLPPIEIEIPEEVKNDAELTALVKESEIAINEFSNNMEYLIEDMKPFMDKKEEDMSTFDKLKFAKIGAEFIANSTKGALVLEKLAYYSDKRVLEKKPLTDKQLKAIAVVYDTFEKRMQQLDKKYQKLSLKK